jgi:GDP-L-fucose synthase
MKSICILITGGSGLVGKAIARQTYPFFENKDVKWYFATSQDADLRVYKETKQLFKKVKPTHVIHLAANVKGIYKNVKNHATHLIDNLNININVLKACNKFNVQRAVVCLSTCIFPKTTNCITEDVIHDGAPSDKIFGYAYAKRMSDNLCRAFNEQYNREYTSIIPCNVYGLEDNFDLNDSQIIPNIIHKAFIAHKTNTLLEIDNVELKFNQFVYVDDMAWLCVWALFKYDTPTETLLFAPDKSNVISLNEIIEIIANCFNVEYKIYNNILQSDYKFISNEKLRNSLERTGFKNFEFTRVDIGIEKTIDWFIENYDKVRGKFL